VIAALLVITVGIGISILVDAEGGPTIGFTNPTDGDWYSSPQVFIEGWARYEESNVSLNMTQIGSDDLQNVNLVGDKVVFRVIKTFGDEFSGTDLDTDRWVIVSDLGSIYLLNGALNLQSQYIKIDFGLPRTGCGDVVGGVQDVLEQLRLRGAGGRDHKRFHRGEPEPHGLLHVLPGLVLR
jgi:hypothetical protein